MVRSAALALGALVSGTAASGAQSVRGLFIEIPSGRPIPDAEVRLWADTATAVAAARTDSAGVFVLLAPKIGKYVIIVRKLGYMGGETNVIDLPTEQEYEIVIRTPRVATTLSKVVVTAESDRGRPWLDGFNRRREAGVGSFLTANQIVERGATGVENMLRGLPGVLIQPAAYGRYVITSSRAGCRMSLYIDGLPGDDDMLKTFARPTDVDALEVYASASDTPAIFQRSGSGGCGVVAFWTRSMASTSP